ncbi:MAG TPA: hypothetical protein PKM69_03060 [Bacteroidales bacterium]|nr:hypothetical protein [Bacteroidales bacterium]
MDNLKNEIYYRNSDGSFYSPFSLSMDEMEHLILVNFEKDPDEYYNTFELQQASDKTCKEWLLVIAYRNDGGADVYHQPGYPLASQGSLLNDVNFTISPLEGAKFVVNDDLLDVFFAFTDRYGRSISVKVNENRKPRKNPFFLLAPIGTLAKQPNSFPIYSLYGMSFAKQKHTDIEIRIGEVRHKPDTFPLPLDCAKNYFSRYSPDTFNVDWNKNFQGQLLPLFPGEDNKTEDSNVIYELVSNGGHHEIKRMSTTNRKHRLRIEFMPPVPDIVCLRDGLKMDGCFIITTDGSTGSIRGGYHVRRRENETEMSINPDKGWIPNETRLILKLLFLIVRVFKDWPKSYEWNSVIISGNTKNPLMKSSWKRI